MRPTGTTPIIFGFILAIGITLTLPYIAFAAGRSYGFAFDPLAISIQQFQPEPTTQPSEPAQLINPPKREFTLSHVGWTVGMEWKTCSQGTGPIRSKPHNIDR